MGRYTGPACRLCRQAGEKLFLKGTRCQTPKCAIERRRRAPGDRRMRRRRPSDYALRLIEKQKLRYSYGLLEGQFVRYLKRAKKESGVTGQRLLQLLERRLDNTVFRLNFAASRGQARQLVTHGHFLVNGRKADIPSIILRQNDVVSWKETSKSRDFVGILAAGSPQRDLPVWLSRDPSTGEGRVIALPELTDADAAVDTRLIVEFYR
jgi:small subunit ribosomal protein S4